MREASTDLLVGADASSNVTDLLLERLAVDPLHALYARRSPNGWLNVATHRFHADVVALAKGLIAGGLAPGDPVAILSRNSYEWTLVDLAIWFAGGVTVPVGEASSAGRIEWILLDSGARRIFVEDGAAATLVQDVLSGSQMLGEGPVPVVRMDYDGALPNLASLTAAGRGVSDAELERQRSNASLTDLASIAYTPGSDGRPKGCEITHGNFVLVARNAIPLLPELLLPPDARTLMFLPLSQAQARTAEMVCLAAGTTVGHTPGDDMLFEDLASFKPTFLLAPPRTFGKVRAVAGHQAAMAGKSRLFSAAARTAVEHSRAVDLQRRGGTPRGWLRTARHAAYGRLVYPELRTVLGGAVEYAVSGGGRLATDDAHFFTGAGIPVLESYGLSETSAPLTVNIPSRRRTGSVGFPFPGTTVRIADDGEILVKGIGVFNGYHSNAASTAKAFTTDGFFRTGDFGELDEQGFLTVTGRKQDRGVPAGGKSPAGS